MHEYTWSVMVALVALPITYVAVYHLVFRLRPAHHGKPFSLPLPEPAQPHWKGKRVSVMDIRSASDPSMIRCLCPATGQLLAEVKAADSASIDRAVTQAAKSQKQWALTSFDERRRVLATISRFITEHQDDVARVACRDTGKTLLDASFGEILVTLEKIAWISKHGEAALYPSKRPGSTNPLMFYKGAEVRYQPLGVVCAMVSWNYPLHNMMGPIVAALFSGNGIVVKCSEYVVWSSLYFVQIARRALQLEGFDPEIVQLVCCWPEAADSLTTHPLLKHITFIGSQPVARMVAKAAADVLVPVVAELGGKDALVVLEDVTSSKIAEIASTILRGTFQAAGQNCIGVERVIAVGKAYTQLESILSNRVGQLRVGSCIDELNDVDMGALISAHHLERLEGLVNSAVEQGATLVAGGKRYNHPKYPLGIYFEPTLLTGVTSNMKIAQEEVFGPILLLMNAGDTDAAVDIANSTEFALGASVFGRSGALVADVANRIRCGNIALNDFAVYHLCQLPFGGVDGSGYGKFGGTEGLRSLCVEKSVCYDRFPLISTFIPKALDYPVPSVAKAWALVKAMNNVGYGHSVWVRFKAVRGLLGL